MDVSVTGRSPTLCSLSHSAVLEAPVGDSTAIRNKFKGCIRNQTFSVHLGWANRVMRHWISICCSLVPQLSFCLYPFCASDSFAIRTAPNASYTMWHPRIYLNTHTYKSHANPTKTQKEIFLDPHSQLFNLRAADGSSTAIPRLISLPSSGRPCRQRFLTPQPQTRSKSCSFPPLLGFWYYPSLQVIAS